MVGEDEGFSLAEFRSVWFYIVRIVRIVRIACIVLYSTVECKGSPFDHFKIRAGSAPCSCSLLVKK